MASAIDQIERTVSGVRVERIVEDELVHVSDIAARTGRSRQSVWQLVKGQRGPGGFPPAFGSGGRHPFWEWADVARWFQERLGEEIERPKYAEFIAAMNAVLEARRRVPQLAPKERRAVTRILRREKHLVGA